MVVALIAFCCVFLMIASAGLLLFYREEMLSRIAAIIPQRGQKVGLSETLLRTSSSIGTMFEKLERVVPKSKAEISVAHQRMIRAGYRDNGALKFFYGSKVILALLLCGVLLITGAAEQNPFIFYCAALGIGYLGPDFWLGRKIKSRQDRLRRGLPDVLDLLVICVEAGLSMDQATARTAQELKSTHPALSDELDIVVLEQHAGRPRSEAWRHMAERTDVDVIRNLVSMLVQSEQFGTSIARVLRTHSDTMRTQRIQEVEEKAAKTTVKLVFPLVLFIFPCLFLVTIGPALIMMSHSFKDLFGN